jgi:serine/threonine-protein kinase 24/25/MST4
MPIASLPFDLPELSLILKTVHPMKVLFLIPKNQPPQLDADKFSKPFREFVSLCLQRDPLHRPSAKELLKHRFIKNAKKSSFLAELIERHELWRMDGGNQSDDARRNNDSGEDEDVSLDDLWDFGTVRNVRHPTVRSTRNKRSAAPIPPSPPSLAEPTRPDRIHANGITSRDYAAVRAPTPPPLPRKEFAHSPTFETVRKAPPAPLQTHLLPQDSNRPIARRRASGSSSDEEERSSTPVQKRKQPSQDSVDSLEDDEGSSILDSVVLPVLDSVRRPSPLPLEA